MNTRKKIVLRRVAVVLLVAIVLVIANPKPTGIGWLDNITGKLKISLGLDLQGGVHLVYQADMSGIEKGQEMESLKGIQNVIEKRVDVYGVSEPIIQTAKSGENYRLIVELAGVRNVEEAKNVIKETPLLEFKEQKGEQPQLSEEQLTQIVEVNEGQEKKAEELLQKALNGDDFAQLAKDNSEDTSAEQGGDLGFFKRGAMVEEFERVAFNEDLQVDEVYSEVVKSQFGYHIIKKTKEQGEGDDKEIQASHILLKRIDPIQMQAMLQPEYESTGLTGQQLERAQMTFNPQTNQPEVSLEFNNEGTEMFKEITERNIDKQVAIFLDGEIISAPVVQDVIRDGRAVINGKFTLQEGKELAQRLNAGALPVPIKLISQQSVEATLGKTSLEKSLKAGLMGLVSVGIFMVLYYRILGVAAVFALTIYTFLMVAILKVSSLTPLSITLTLAGIAGFILSIGMAVDANILIFERIKEEIKKGRDLKSATSEGFRKAWPSIRDGNFSTILTALILILFGTGFIKGFAITLTIGVLVSMFTAIVITRVILNLILVKWFERHKFLILAGANKKK